MKNFLTLLLFVTAWSCAAQQPKSVFDFKTAVSFNPIVLAATDNTAMAGVEHRLRNRLALLLDAGYIFSTYYVQAGERNGVGGFTFRPGLKLYGKHGNDDFIQFQISYKQVDYKFYDWLGKACVNGVPTYEQLQQFSYRKKTLSFNVLAGQLFRLSDAFLLELYGGAGIKIKNQRPVERGACYRNNERGFIYSPFRERSVSVNLPLGVKILAALK